jgi:uncharacterized membrane protein YraQ (UPF0718 family)
MILFIWVLAILLTIFSLRKDKAKTKEALKKSVASFKKLLGPLIIMIVVLGLILAIVSKENLLAIFSHQGVFGFVLVSLVGAILTIPGPIAYPLAGSLLKIGVSKAILASFVTTLTMVGIVTSPFESGFFGKKFTFMRQSLSLIAAVIIGLVMGKVL